MSPPPTPINRFLQSVSIYRKNQIKVSIPRFILRGIGRGSYHVFEVKVCDSLYVVLFRFALFDLSGVDPFVLSRTIVQFNLYFNKVSQMFICGFWVKKNLYNITKFSLREIISLSWGNVYDTSWAGFEKKKIELNFIFPFFFTVECRWWLLVRIQTLPQIPWIAPEHAVILLHRQ